MTYGKSKPKDLDFFNESLSEIKEILEQGVVAHGINVPCKLPAIIRDNNSMATLAVTAVIKKGEHKKGRMPFLQVDDLNMKTNDLFRSLIQPLHHKGDC